MGIIPGKDIPSGSGLTKEPKSTFESLLNKGNDYWLRRNYKKALKFYDLAIDLKPEDERPWNNKGIVLRNLGKIKEARVCFLRAIENNPNNPVIKDNLESIDSPLPSLTSSGGIGFSGNSSKIIPILKIEVPKIMVTAVVMVSAILFFALFTLYRASEDLWAENFQYLTLGLTSVSLMIIFIALFSQIHYLIPIIEYEIRIFLIFLLGVVMIMIVPIHESLGLFASGELYSGSNVALFVIGSIFVGFSTLLFYFKGGYFLPWLLGVIIFMITAFHEFFRFVVFTETFGVFDQATAVSGIILTFIGLFLFVIRKVVNILLSRSENLHREGKLEEAMRYHNLILKLNPYNEVAWNDKGNILFEIGDYEEAIKCYNRALKLDSTYEIARYNLDLLQQSINSRA